MRPRSMEPRSLMPMGSSKDNAPGHGAMGPQSLMPMSGANGGGHQGAGRPPFASGSSDEDPYSVAGSGSSGSSGNGNRSRFVTSV